MTLLDLHQVNSVRTKLIDFISEYDFYCSSSWHYSVNAGEQHRQLLEVDSHADRKEYCYSKHERAGIL